MTHIDKTQSKNKSSFIVLNDTLDVGDNSYRCLEVPIDGDFFLFWGRTQTLCIATRWTIPLTHNKILKRETVEGFMKQIIFFF